MNRWRLVVGGLLLAAAATAGETMAPAMHTTVMPDQVTWGPAPPGLPPGSKAAVLAGNPGVEGPFTLRGWLPKGYKIPPHWHGSAEYLTVLSGSLRVGMGETMDTAKSTVLGQGGFSAMPAEMRHWVVAESDTVLQIHGTGPFAITYVNPGDDPRQMMPASK